MPRKLLLVPINTPNENEIITLLTTVTTVGVFNQVALDTLADVLASDLA